MCTYTVIGIAQSSEIIKYFFKKHKKLEYFKEKHTKRGKKGKEDSNRCILLLIYMFTIACCLPSGNSLCCPGTTHIFTWLCLITKQRIQTLLRLGIVHSCTVSTVIVWFNFKPPVANNLP